MALHLGGTAPDFEQASSLGKMRFHDWAGDSWVVLFSHPADFTPVCTTELGLMAKLTPEFDNRNVKALALSAAPAEQHKEWIQDIEQTRQTVVGFPIIADADKKVPALYDMIHPNQSETATVRSLFIIDPKRKARLMMTYPMSTGRNFDEVLRVINVLQITDSYTVSTTGNWADGEDVIIPLSVQDEEVIRQKYPKGHTASRPYLRMTPRPNRSAFSKKWVCRTILRISKSPTYPHPW